MNLDLGFIKAIHSGAAAPTNQKMVWYNEGDNLLYYYDVVQSRWMPLSIQPYKYQAGESISKNRVVRYDVTSGKVRLADKDSDRDRADTIVGVSLNDANTNDEVLVTDFYFIEDSGWSWNTAKKIFLGSAGELTQTQPTQGVLLEVAEAATPQRMRVNLKRAIKLLGTPNSTVPPVAATAGNMPAPILAIDTAGSGHREERQRLLLRWNGENPALFSDPTVEIWLFRSRRVTTVRDTSAHRLTRFAHPSKYSTGDKFSGGGITRPFGFGSVEAEYPVPASILDKVFFELPFNQIDWFRSENDPNGRLPEQRFYPVADGYSSLNVWAFGGSGSRLATFRFAFVVKDGGGYKIGAMSDILRVYWDGNPNLNGGESYTFKMSIKPSR